MIALEDVWLKLGATPVLSGLSLTLEPGEVLALLGPSGAGKTTVVRLILGFIAPERGSVRLNGAVASADGRVLRLAEERNLAVVLQELALWPHLTVAGNLAFGLEVDRRERFSFPRVLACPRSSRAVARLTERRRSPLLEHSA